MKNFKLLLTSFLLCTSISFGMQKEKQRHNEVSKPIAVQTQRNLSNHHTNFQPLVLQSNNNREYKQNGFSQELLVNQQARGSHQPALSLEKQYELLLVQSRQDFLKSTEMNLDIFQQLTKANIEKLKNLSPCEIINQKNIYEKNLIQSINAHTKILNKVGQETKILLETEAKTNAQQAAEAMESRAKTTNSRITCYQEAAIIKDLQTTMSLCKQAIKDCDHQLEIMQSKIIKQLQLVAEKVDTETLIGHIIPSFEKKLQQIQLMIQRYENDPIKLAEYKNEYFIFKTQLEYAQKVIQTRQFEQKVKNLVESQTVLKALCINDSALESHQLLKIIDGTIAEKANSSYNVNQVLNSQAKSLLTSMGIDVNAYEKRFVLDGVQAHLWNEANAKLNEVATLYASGSADAKIKQHMDNLVKMHCQTIDSIRDGNPQEAIAAFKANSVLQKVTLLACDPKMSAAIAPAQLDMVLTSATNLAQTGFAAAKKGNLEHSVTITDAAHGIIDCVKAASTYAVDFAQNTVARNTHDLKLAGEAIKHVAHHPIETLAKLCEVTVKAAATLGEYDQLSAQVLQDKAHLEIMVTKATEFTKVLNEATQHVSNMSWQERLEKAAEITVDTMIWNKAFKAIGAVHSLAAKQTQLILGKLGNAQAVLDSSKALITAEEGLATAVKTQSAEMTAAMQGTQQAKDIIGTLAKDRPESIWAKINPTQARWNEYTLIPKSFEFEVEGKKFWVNPNGSKHLMEITSPIAEFRHIPDPSRIRFDIPARETLLTHESTLNGLYDALKVATKDGIPLNEQLIVGNWELKIGSARIPGGHPTLIHARPIS